MSIRWKISMCELSGNLVAVDLLLRPTSVSGAV